MTIQIKQTNRKTISIEVTKREEVIVRAPLHMSRRRIEKFVEQHLEWIEIHLDKVRKEREERRESTLTEDELHQLYKQSKQFIPKRVAYFASIMGVTYGRITIRNQKTRWGSCSSKGNLNFNCQLMRLSPEIIDYVVVHELCHRKEMNHSPSFWAEVERVLPDYRQRRAQLKKAGLLPNL